MNELNPNEYRNNLAKKLKGARELDKDLANQYLEKTQETEMYKNTRTEKISNFKKDTENKEKQIKIDALKEEIGQIGIKESKENNAEQEIISVLIKAKNSFENEKEFGKDGIIAARKVDQIIRQLQSFFSTLKNDYKNEYDNQELKPEEFMYKYGIASLKKDHGGYSSRAIEDYNFDEIKKDNKTIKTGARSFENFDVCIFIKNDWKAESRKIPIIGKWHKEEQHVQWFNPRQEKFLYQILTGKTDINDNAKNKEYYDSTYGGETVIPNVNLILGKESSSKDKLNPDETPISKGLMKRHYGWTRRESFLRIKPDLIKKVLEEVQLD